MNWPQNDASPGATVAVWFVGTWSYTPEGEPPGGMLRPAAIW